MKARGNVEDWLGKVEESMFVSLRKAMKYALLDYLAKDRVVWVLEHASQVAINQIPIFKNFIFKIMLIYVIFRVDYFNGVTNNVV